MSVAGGLHAGALLGAGAAAASRRRRGHASLRAPAAVTASAGGPTPPWNSKWPTGIPPEMGGHKMASGTVAPLSRSTGAGTGAKIPFAYHDTDTNASVEVRAAPAAARAATPGQQPPQLACAPPLRVLPAPAAAALLHAPATLRTPPLHPPAPRLVPAAAPGAAR